MSEVVCRPKYSRPNRVANIEPRWLVSMLTKWTEQFIVGARRGLNYPTQDAYLTIVRSPPASSDGIGFGDYTESDFKDVDEAIFKLKDERHELFAALMMYYRPWMRYHFIMLGYPTGTKTFYNRLHEAHRWLAPILEPVERRLNISLTNV